MGWDRIQDSWRQMRGTIKEQWRKLTDDDLDCIDGKREQLVGALQLRYGKARSVLEREVRDFERRMAADEETWLIAQEKAARATQLAVGAGGAVEVAIGAGLSGAGMGGMGLTGVFGEKSGSRGGGSGRRGGSADEGRGAEWKSSDPQHRDGEKNRG